MYLYLVLASIFIVLIITIIYNKKANESFNMQSILSTMTTSITPSTSPNTITLSDPLTYTESSNLYQDFANWNMSTDTALNTALLPILPTNQPTNDFTKLLDVYNTGAQPDILQLEVANTSALQEKNKALSDLQSARNAANPRIERFSDILYNNIKEFDVFSPRYFDS